MHIKKRYKIGERQKLKGHNNEYNERENNQKESKNNKNDNSHRSEAQEI